MASETLSWSSQAITMSAALMVFLYEGFAYNGVFLHRILPAQEKQAFVVPFLLIFNVVWGLAMWSYIRAHAADPGAVPARWQEFVHVVGDALPIAPARPEWQPGKATFCKKCDIPRPERAHHCVVCGVCVMRMDHHCPWINNCVGFKNHKFFLLLGIYACLASYIALLTSVPELVVCVGSVFRMEDGFDWAANQLEITDVLAFLIFGFLALFIAALLTPMLMAHLPLAAMNLTTIEDNYKNMPNPFDQGGTSTNLAQILGAYGPDWFFPIEPWRPLSDGVSFTRCDERIGPSGLPERLEGEPDAQIEDVWRLRYHVRNDNIELAAAEEESPFTSFTRLWACSRVASI